MNRKITLLVVVLSIMTIAISGCKKEKEKDQPKNEPIIAHGGGSAKYEIKLNEEVLIKSESGFADISESINGINSAISVLDKFNLDVNQIKENINIENIHNLKTGQTIQLGEYGDLNNKTEVSVMEKLQESKGFEIIEGTLTRNADNKLSFTATKISSFEQINGDYQITEKEVTLSGYVISDIIKKIGQSDEDL